jgi:1,4-dihydroxy-2-naphthoate octaprenyltransferase
VQFGELASRKMFASLLLGPFALLPVIALVGRSPMLLLPLILLPIALHLRDAFERCTVGTAFTEVLFRTFRLELWFAALLSAGALAGRSFA